MATLIYWLVVSNIFYVHSYLGKLPILPNIYQNGLKPPASLCVLLMCSILFQTSGDMFVCPAKIWIVGTLSDCKLGQALMKSLTISDHEAGKLILILCSLFAIMGAGMTLQISLHSAPQTRTII